ncbi:hypothetical protein BHE74_00048359 [Ensete ventricosum]|nr:hypothetical protein BHE74_00048359 [Ensete ventricosum]
MSSFASVALLYKKRTDYLFAAVETRGQARLIEEERCRFSRATLATRGSTTRRSRSFTTDPNGTATILRER